MYKILITGGSGFIGTNLLESLIRKNEYRVLSIDIEKPKNKGHEQYWEKIDITNKQKINALIFQFNPDYVIHLAARTDLRGDSIDAYGANTVGVKNLLDTLDGCPNLKRVIFASSMYVCQPGYLPTSPDDYHPHTAYGESKVMTETIIKEKNPQNYGWCIIRPTSIWGPWFGEPYADFFHIIMGRKYFHMGKRACTKTYGYIENFVYQIESLLKVPKEQIHQKVFYLGDWPAYNISDWADEIAEYTHIRIPHLPFFLFRLLAWGGDFLKILGIKFPMTSFRLKNMVTDNIHDLSPIQKLAPDLPVTRKEGVRRTVAWINSQRKRNAAD
ncbi:MAG: NAD(P)-dependent oxidoreductase [Desulfobacter postgatei]|uniref:NAD-dependent epimerase/dehydratase family protein n=1 Tax=Desulfobacter postgatei TaxID=2293 RepID=UPI0023F20847|nr:NAD(P)-dependent oxidoreductase [Desulfobacter postgatei]MDD4275144.1 NAD(P)-dependent oxidoreductase [Desulfobacter postgatei]